MWLAPEIRITLYSLARFMAMVCLFTKARYRIKVDLSSEGSTNSTKNKQHATAAHNDAKNNQDSYGIEYGFDSASVFFDVPKQSFLCCKVPVSITARRLLTGQNNFCGALVYRYIFFCHLVLPR